MIDRCYNEKSKDYKSYGYKGITVCEEWRNNSKNYFNWCIKNNIGEGMEIDRINNYKWYSPENCQVITKTENLLKQIGLTVEDVRYIRSPSFEWFNDRKKYKCSNLTLNNIINYKTFKDVK